MSKRTPYYPPRIDHATLIAALCAERDMHSAATQREACKKILAQVYRVVASVLGPRSPDVADATQDAFLRIHKAILTFEPNPEKPASATAWVNKIALNVALDRRRSDAAPADDVVDSDDLGDLEHFVMIDLDEAMDRTKLAEALLSLLDEQHRAVLVLRYWSEQTDEEIAETLGIPLGTVKTRVRAATAKLELYARGYGVRVQYAVPPSRVLARIGDLPALAMQALEEHLVLPANL